LAEEEYVKARELAKEWKNTVKKTHEEAKQMRRDAIRPRNINFDGTTRHKPLATPKDNMKKAAELQAKDNDQIDIEHLRTVIATAVKQQSKVDTSRKLESNSDACVSTAQNRPSGKPREHRDDQSCTGSSERQ
jgi:hypothetical protein